MTNIIRSQWFLCKKRWFTILLCIIFPLIAMFFALSLEGSVRSFAGGAMIAMLGIMLIPIFVVTYSYAERTQLYEIMAGFSPHQILLGKAIVYLVFTMLYLIVISAEVLCFDHSAETLLRVALYWIICIRAVLSVVLLSPVLKSGSAAPTFSFMLLIAFDDPNNVADSPLSVFYAAQNMMLGAELTGALIIRIIVSAVVACVIYYLVGYFTLKKKFDLEPYQLT